MDVATSYCFMSQCLSVIKRVLDKQTRRETRTTRTPLVRHFANPVATLLSSDVPKRKCIMMKQVTSCGVYTRNVDSENEPGIHSIVTDYLWSRWP